MSGRPPHLDGVESVVGLFINTLPVAVDVDGGLSLGQLLDGLQADKVAVLDHQHVSLAEIAAAVGESVLFDTFTVHESYPVDTDSIEGLSVGGLVGARCGGG